MANKEYISSALHCDTPIDCRRLTLSLSFYQLDQLQTMELNRQLIQWIYDLTNTDFIYDCSHNGKRINIKKLQGLLQEKFNPERGLSVGFEAYVVSPVVYNISSLRKYQRFVRYENPAYFGDWGAAPGAGESSIDYPTYFDQLFPSDRPADNEIPHLIHQMFCEPDKKLLSYHNGADLTGSFTADCYKAYPDQYYGQAELSFSAFCLGNLVDRMADSFALFARRLAESFVNINAHVGLQPKIQLENPYMRYFGTHICVDGSHEEANCSVKEWYPTYYLCRVEWMNILSPLAKQHIIPAALNEKCDQNVNIQELPNGGLVVKSLRPITQYSVSDAFAIKKILLPALYPGWSSVPLRGMFPRGEMPRIYAWCPRNDWAIVPIDEREIEIVGTDLVFTALNAIE